MRIKRFPYPGLGRCEAVVSDGMVYAVVTSPQAGGTVVDQTHSALAELDRIFETTGSGKAGLLQATI
ncbi:MAG: hypothetical protein AAF822_16605 [Pseudomonadota bacterium]